MRLLLVIVIVSLLGCFGNNEKKSKRELFIPNLDISLSEIKTDENLNKLNSHAWGTSHLGKINYGYIVSDEKIFSQYWQIPIESDTFSSSVYDKLDSLSLGGFFVSCKLNDGRILAHNLYTRLYYTCQISTSTEGKNYCVVEIEFPRLDYIENSEHHEEILHREKIE